MMGNAEEESILFVYMQGEMQVFIPYRAWHHVEAKDCWCQDEDELVPMQSRKQAGFDSNLE
jgi:hypothetical protein